MDELRQRITEDLSGEIQGELRCDALAVSLYSSDASLFQVAPLGVVYPRNAHDVALIAQYAGEKGLPLIPRGAGTGLAGSSIGSGLVVDFSRHMNQIESIGPDVVRVQPGVVLSQLNRQLALQDRYFPPDPANWNVTTIGGMLGVDAAGSHSVRVGSTRDHVHSIDVTLAGGEQFTAGWESIDFSRQQPLTDPDSGFTLTKGELSSVKRTIVSKLVKLLNDNRELIRERQPLLVRNCSGYYLRGVLKEDSLNLGRLLVGSEGTLGLFTSATLHTAPLPAHRGVVLLLFGDVETAVKAVGLIAPLQPSACDLVDRRLLSLAREANETFERLITPAAEAALIVEQFGFSHQQVCDRIAMILGELRTARVAVVAHEAYQPEEVEFFWSLPRTVVPLLARLKGDVRPLPFVEDIAVAPEMLYEFLQRAQRTLQQHELTASLYAHAAAGQVHLRPFLPVQTADQVQRIESIASDLYDIVFSLGGTISGEHGDGLSRTSFLQRQYGPLYAVFQQVKELFDPHNLLNPGKILNAEPHSLTFHHRPVPQNPSPLVDLQLNWSADDLAQAALRCNGCGTCRTQEETERMCPMFRVLPIEDASPRAKGNIMRNLANGTLSPDEMQTREFKELADLCFNCKQCQLECPSHVDIPHLMIEAKAQHVAVNGLPRSQWLLAQVHQLGTLGCTLSMALNWALNNPSARWAIDRILGISRQRKVPNFARRPFIRSMPRSLARKPLDLFRQPTVVYFIDHYANIHDPEIAEAFVAVMKHNGIRVHVPAGQTVSGMAMLSNGDLESARGIAEQNLRELADFAREGIPIVCTEPTAALCIKEEYPYLTSHPDMAVVAEQTIEAGAFLLDWQRRGKLREDFRPLRLQAGYHTPCHLKALGHGAPSRDLLTLIPDLDVHTIDYGCSGMGSGLGLNRQSFASSIRIGWPLISRMREGDLQVGVTECSSCKLQMEQGTDIPTVHPIKLFALAYGLMPELKQKLKPSKRKYTVT